MHILFCVTRICDFGSVKALEWRSDIRIVQRLDAHFQILGPWASLANFHETLHGWVGEDIDDPLLPNCGLLLFDLLQGFSFRLFGLPLCGL